MRDRTITTRRSGTRAVAPLGALLAVVLVAGTFATATPHAAADPAAPTARALEACTEAPYADVGVDHPFCAEIARARAEGIVLPRAYDQFRPGAIRMRASAAANLVLVTNPPATDVCRTAPPFSDLFHHTTFCTQIAQAAEAGLVDGYADGTFRPFSPLSRQAAAVFVHRLDATRPAGGPCVAPLASPFADVPADHPFCTEIATLAAEGIIDGYDDATFRPTAPLSHQAWMAFLVRHITADAE